MTNPTPPARYAHRDVDPLWNAAPLDGGPFLAHFLTHLDLVVLHQDLLHAAMPKRLHGKKIAPERKATHLLIQSWHEAGLALRFGAGLLEVRKSQELHLLALDADAVMPRDGMTRALRWAQRGTSDLHRREAREVQRLLDVFYD